MKTSSLNIRIADDQLELLHAAAEAAHENMSEFVRRVALQSASAVLAERGHFVVDSETWDAYTRLLDAPADVKPELVELFEQPDMFVERVSAS